MIYRPNSSQEVVHCDTCCKFSAILKVKVTAFFCCYFQSVLEIENIVFLFFLIMYYNIQLRVIEKNYILETGWMVNNCSSFHQFPKCNSICWFVSYEFLTACYSRAMLWLGLFVFGISSRKLGFNARIYFVWFVVDILVLGHIFLGVLHLFLVGINLPMPHTHSFHSSITDSVHPCQLSTYENIPYYSVRSKYLPRL
jgi:hypothetical protein